MFKSNIIRKRVLAIVNEKIAEKQVEYDNECVEMDTCCEDEIRAREAKLSKDKDALLERTVHSIIGKIIE